MNISKKILAMILVLVMVTSLMGGMGAFAADSNADFGIKVVDKGASVDLVLHANVSLSSLGYTYSFDQNAFEYAGMDTLFGSKAEGDRVGLSDTVAKTGDVVIMHFNKLSGYAAGTAYTFTVVIDDAEDDDFNNYSWAEDSFSTTYKEAGASYTVKFVSNGATLSTAEVESGKTVSKPADPTRDGYTFGGWQLNGAAYDFSAPVTGNLTLTAKWTKVGGGTGQAVDLGKVEITKKVSSSVSYDETTFTFNVSNGTYNGSNDFEAPEIDVLYITVSGNDKAKTVKFPSDVEFPGAGVYTYTVTEKTDEAIENWTLDTASYTVSFEIEKDASGKLVLDKVAIKNASGTKTESMEFTNTYSNLSSLKVTKTVDGGAPVDGNQNPYADETFHFTIIFTAPEVAPDATPKMSVNGGDAQEFAYGETVSFALKHGEYVDFSDIAEGATYVLVEQGTDYYTGKAVVKSGNDSDAVNGTYEQDVTVNGTIAKDSNQVDFTNTYSITPPTGLLMHTELWLVIGFAVIAAAGYFFIARRRKETD